MKLLVHILKLMSHYLSSEATDKAAGLEEFGIKSKAYKVPGIPRNSAAIANARSL